MTVVHYHTTGNVAVLTVDNPPVNALSADVRRQLVDACTRAEADDAVAAVVVTGTGRLFSAGADISEFGATPTEPLLPDVVHSLEACTKPVLAAINGKALGGGLEVALGCHYRIAAADASMGLPEIHLGLLPGAGGTQRLPRLIGVEAAAAMMLDGKPVDAAGALELGLVDAVVEPDVLVDEAIRLARARVADGVRRLRDEPVAPPAPGYFDELRASVARRTRGLLSPEKILQCVAAATTLDYASGVAREREAFQACRESPQSDGLRHVFFAERQVAKIPGIGADTPVRDLQRVAVIGAGTMGAGIAYAALVAGFEVFLLDSDADGLDRGLRRIDGYVEQGVERGKLDAAAAARLRSRLASGADVSAVSDADLVIEAVFEDMRLKKDVFRKLDRVCRRGAILATNTSTLDIDTIAGATTRPGDVIGLHFFSPAHIMRLLEIVRGTSTADEVVATAQSLARRLGKIGVVVGNCFGFVGNRMLYGYGRENQFLLLEGAAPDYIDRTLYDWGMAMGPNAVGDLAGLDVGYRIRRERDDLPDDPRYYRIADMLAEQGRYGQKTGRGMYLYADGSRTPQPDADVEAMIRAEAERLGVDRREVPETEIIERCIYALVVEGARILEEGIALRAGDIDVVWTNGYGFPRHRGGPMHYADRVGLATVYRSVSTFAERFGREYWEPPALLADLARAGRTFAGLDAKN